MRNWVMMEWEGVGIGEIGEGGIGKNIIWERLTWFLGKWFKLLDFSCIGLTERDLGEGRYLCMLGF